MIHLMISHIGRADGGQNGYVNVYTLVTRVDSQIHLSNRVLTTNKAAVTAL